MFTRQFIVYLHGDPEEIARWVQSCPGVADPACQHETAPDGTVTHEIPAGGGALRAELVHHPATGTVRIYTCWS